MSCPTCDGTMQALCHHAWWCPRCGTIKTNSGKPALRVDAPKLVERCRTFATLLPTVSLAPDRVAGEWRRLGIAESIQPPADRPA